MKDGRWSSYYGNLFRIILKKSIWYILQKTLDIGLCRRKDSTAPGKKYKGDMVLIVEKKPDSCVIKVYKIA